MTIATCATCSKTGKLGNAIMKVGTLHLCKDCSQTMKDRIKLAEAIGWTWDETSCKRGEFADNRCYWIRPNGLKWYPAKAMPDPFTNANDCDAVVRFLNNRNPGCAISIEHYANGHATVDVWTDDQLDSDTWSGDDWKQGVCELALKVIQG